MYLRKRSCERSGRRAGKDGNGPGPWPPRRWPSCSSWRQNSGPARFRPLPRQEAQTVYMLVRPAGSPYPDPLSLGYIVVPADH